MSAADNATPNIFWHRELPPLDATPIGEHVVEAQSSHVSGDIARNGELWEQCQQELMATAKHRLEQEISRLGGRCAHVLEEHIEDHKNDATAESWLAGRFTYVLYR